MIYVKRRIFALMAGGVLLLTALTGCSAGKTVSKAESKMQEDTSSAMDKVESFLDGDNSGTISDGHASDGFVDDEAHDGSSLREDESEASRLHEDDETSRLESSRIESSTPQN